MAWALTRQAIFECLQSKKHAVSLCCVLFRFLGLCDTLSYLVHLIQTGAQASREPSPSFVAPEPSAFITQISVYSAGFAGVTSPGAVSIWVTSPRVTRAVFTSGVGVVGRKVKNANSFGD